MSVCREIKFPTFCLKLAHVKSNYKMRGVYDISFLKDTVYMRQPRSSYKNRKKTTSVPRKTHHSKTIQPSHKIF